MKSKAIVLTCMLCGLFSGCHTLPKTQDNYSTNKKFTPWMTSEEISKLGKGFEEQKQWVTGLEGRWKNGIPEWRVRYEHAPASGNYWWGWYYNQDENFFSEHLNKFADEGCTLVYYQSFVRPDGNRRYQAVWHKIEKVNTVQKVVPDKEPVIGSGGCMDVNLRKTKDGERPVKGMYQK